MSARRIVNLALVLVMVAGMQALLPSPRAQAAGNTLELSVVAASTNPDAPGGLVSSGDPVTEYEWLINVDNTGDPSDTTGCAADDPGYPDSCDWPSVREVPGAAPIYASGNQDDFNGVLSGGVDMPNGKYLISVLADGYKLGGTHFTVPMTGVVEVAVHPNPLPAATLRIKVFHDISPTNGQIDVPAEFGLPGFTATVNDTLGQVSTDVFGEPLCTQYDANDEPIPGTGDGSCLVSDANGDIVVPNLGPLRYDILVSGPDGENWLETTTLEGGWSWDTWLAEGGTGLDNEFVIAGEPFPWTVFGFVQPTDQLNDAGVTGGIEGTIVGASVYLPQTGGLPYFGDIWTGFNGTKVQGPIEDAYVALSDLQNGDTAVYVGAANADGTFAINNVPDGNYLMAWWDYNLFHILDWIQVTVSDGQMTDVGTPFLTGWFTKWDGYVFDDLNLNGRKDVGEPGISGYTVVLRDRDNSEIDRMSIAAVTDEDGYYVLPKGYPLSSWMILEAYSDLHYGTGITYQVENQAAPTTVLGNGVDVGVLPILGQHGQLDWGVRPYAPGTNGGIVGTVSYDTTRAELDPQYAGAEPWQPGIPGLDVNLYLPIPCGTNPGVACSTDAGPSFELTPEGALAKGPLINTVLTETWEQPTDCVARDANGDPLTHGPNATEFVLASSGGDRCLEGPLMGTQIQSGFASLDGNYGFGDGCLVSGLNVDPAQTGHTGACVNPLEELAPLPADYYLVEVDPGIDALGRDAYNLVREEDINTGDGDAYVPAVPPPACAGDLHTVDVAGVGTDGYPSMTLANGVVVPASSATVNPTFAEGGGSPWEGEARPLCDTKLVNLVDQGSIAPLFYYFTDVPIPGKWKGYIIDDLTVSTDNTSLSLGEKAGLADSPIGIYDFTNQLVTTITSDYNGVYEVLLPSTHTVNCPSPAGVCSAMYYILGNDPGQPGALNSNYNPQYRTIGATFEIYAGVMVPSDLAPTQIVPGVLAGGSAFGTPPQCDVPVDTPRLLAVDKPYGEVNDGNGNNNVADAIVIDGEAFGAPGEVRLVGVTTEVLPVTSWSANQISVAVPSDTPFGDYQLEVETAAGAATEAGLTYRVYRDRGGARADKFEVGPGQQYATIQAAIDAAAGAGGNREKLVVVYPGTPAQWNPSGAYFENLIVSTPIKIQGVGPGGFRADDTYVPGSVIDGRGVAGDTPYSEQWLTAISEVDWDGSQAIYEGPVFTVVAKANGNKSWNDGRFGAIDGFTITGGDQQGFPNNVGLDDPNLKEAQSVQGGGIFVNGYARYLQITNNVMQSNGGAYGGAIRLGTPHLPGALNDNQNDFVRIAHNRIIANGGTNLAGAIAIFSGSEGYEVDHNTICGNFSAEYGGGISHYGLSPNGQIHHNEILFNRSYDEGGGIMIAGELSANPAVLSTGAGPVQVYANLVQNNLANDDGGGLRFLQAGNFPYDVHDNMFVNNVSTHEGGGVSVNDTPDVAFYNNTVMKNITTASAVTSNGFPAPAGLSSSQNSATLQATLPGGSPIFSDPLLFNNVFWDNRAGTFTGAGVAGIGLPGDPNPIFNWDLGVADGTGLLSPTNSLLQTTTGTNPHGSNVVGSNPSVVAEFDSTISVAPWRGNPRFVDILIVTVTAGTDIGDYHLQAGSPAIDIGADAKLGVSGLTTDIDDELRPAGAVDAGGDELVTP